MPRLVPGPLAVFHRVFMTTALVAVLIYAAWALRAWTEGEGTGAAVQAGVAVVVAIAMTRYLWSLRGIGARPRPDRR